MDMELSWNMGSELRSKVTTAALLILAASCFVGGFFGTWGTVSGLLLVDAAAYGSTLVLVCASILVFIRPRWGHGLGALSGLIALALLVWAESSSFESSWIVLNESFGLISERDLALAVRGATLRIVSVALLSLVVVVSGFRLLPARWSLGWR